jgi:hypothetical protein
MSHIEAPEFDDHSHAEVSKLKLASEGLRLISGSLGETKEESEPTNIKSTDVYDNIGFWDKGQTSPDTRNDPYQSYSYWCGAGRFIEMMEQRSQRFIQSKK